VLFTGRQCAVPTGTGEVRVGPGTSDGERLRELAELLRALGVTDLADLPVDRAREAFGALTVLQGEPEPVQEVRELRVPGAAGPLPARVYQPGPAHRGAAGPLPLLVYFHAGGFVLGDLEFADRPCRALANASGAMVASVQYRKAPEAPFPAAPRDALAATRWFVENAGRLGGDPARIGVAGEDAGANLATVVAQAAAGRHGPVIALQLLLYPIVDFAEAWPSRLNPPKGALPGTRALERFTDLYLGAAGRADRRDARLSPLRAADLSGLPPTMLVTAGLDPLRDEGRGYAAALAGAGVPVCTRHEPTMVHGFCSLTGSLERAREVIGEVGAWAGDLFAAATTAAS
jgi:acetyl esterase